MDEPWPSRLALRGQGENVLVIEGSRVLLVIPAGAVRRSAVLGAVVRQQDVRYTSLDPTQLSEWIRFPEVLPSQHRQLVSLLKVSVSLEDATSAHAAAEAVAGQLRRHYRRGAEAQSPRDELRRLNRKMSTASLPEPLLQGLNELPHAAAVVLAAHIRLHEVMALPAAITQQVVNNTLADDSGHVQATFLADADQAGPAGDPAIGGNPRANLLRAVLPCLHGTGLCRLSLPHRLPQGAVGDLISSGVLSHSSLRSLQLCTAQLPLPEVAHLLSRATGLTALRLSDVDTESEANAATAQQLASLQDVPTAEPSPGRPEPYPWLHHSSTTAAGPVQEAQALQVAQAISQLQQLRSLQLRPPMSLSSRFWQHLGQSSGLTSLELAFLSPEAASQAPPAPAHNIFRALPSFAGLAELHLHGRRLSTEAQRALIEELSSMTQLSALTLKFHVESHRLAPLSTALAAMPALRHLSLLLHPTGAAEDLVNSAAFAAAWPSLTALSSLRSLSLPFANLTAAAEVFRSTHRHLTSFQRLQTLHLPFISLTQPDVWLHVAQLSALTALRLGGFVGPAGSVPDVWLQAVATAVCACAQLRRLEAESAVDEVLPWLGAYLSQLGGLQDLRITSARPGARLTVSALTPALPTLTALTRLELGSTAHSSAAHGRHAGGFPGMQRRRAQTAVLLASLAMLTGLQALGLWGVLGVDSGVEEAQVLGGSLRQLRQLTWLDLSHSVLPQATLRVLAPALGEVGGLRELALRGSGVDDAGAVALAGAVMALRNLRRLDVRRNAFGPRGARLLLTAVVELPLEEGVLV